MELNPVSTPISPVQNSPIVQPQAEPEATEEQAKGKANGVVRKLNEGSHFNAVANARLRINHFDNPDLEKIDPALLPDPESIPGKAYEKFLAQYRDLYNAALPPTEPEEPVIVTPLEIEPVAVLEQTEPVTPLDQGQGIWAAFEELLDTGNLEQEPQTLNIII